MNNIKQHSDWEYNIFNSSFIRDTQAQGQWFGILSFLFLVAGLIVTIYICSLLILQKYIIVEDNQIDEGGGTRPPTRGMLFSFVNYAIRILYIIYIIIVLTFLCYIIPAKQRSLMSYLKICNVCVGTLVGYLSPKVCKNFGIKKWIANIIFISILCPGLSWGLLYTTHTFAFATNDSVALPFSILQVILWVCVSVPFTFMGAFIAFCNQTIENSVRINQIPDQLIYVQTFPGFKIGEGYKPLGFVHDT